MAHYIQDYIYSEVPVDTYVEFIRYNSVEELPEPSEHNFLQVAIVEYNTTEIYICVKKDGVFVWSKLPLNLIGA